MGKEINPIMCYCYMNTIWIIAPSTAAKKKWQGYFKGTGLKLKKMLLLKNASEIHSVYVGIPTI